ncbi:MAG: winged helix-turn-helix domain-containing protein [Halobacteriota archaeon]|nr:winged helix-turn-helix domain-containing protein [Halobacteriota archaeon]
MSRSRVEIMVDILVAALTDAAKSKIALSANLRDETVDIYLDLLVQEGLLNFWSYNNTYKTTEKGKRLIKKAEKIFM